MTCQEYYDIWAMSSESRDLSFTEWLCMMLERKKEKNKPINDEELEYLANICYYDFDSEDNCINCPRFNKCREKASVYGKDL